ncbi:hypothetical protein DFH05DRAFT_13354 [Lentinula detonsa]|uniref:Uncharacterized protein n=1 Tax=Lentinula detonsa TaxID=2804962 RepID=A0A9W8U2K4_9AGAR|nr:hypothetical protein DFH05DRAFT_13354 [Lentinula detonsa]
MSNGRTRCARMRFSKQYGCCAKGVAIRSSRDFQKLYRSHSSPTAALLHLYTQLKTSNFLFAFSSLNSPTMSAPNTRVTRGKKVNIDPSLLPRTREERKSEKNEKITKAQVAKEAFDAEQSQKAAKAKQKIALVEDKRALEQAERQSLRPDLIYQGHLPPPSASTVIRTGSSARTPKPGNQIELQVTPELVPSCECFFTQ